MRSFEVPIQLRSCRFHTYSREASRLDTLMYSVLRASLLRRFMRYQGSKAADTANVSTSRRRPTNALAPALVHGSGALPLPRCRELPQAPRISWCPPLKFDSMAALKRRRETLKTNANEVSRIVFSIRDQRSNHRLNGRFLSAAKAERGAPKTMVRVSKLGQTGHWPRKEADTNLAALGKAAN